MLSQQDRIDQVLGSCEGSACSASASVPGTWEVFNHESMQGSANFVVRTVTRQSSSARGGFGRSSSRSEGEALPDFVTRAGWPEEAFEEQELVGQKRGKFWPRRQPRSNCAECWMEVFAFHTSQRDMRMEGARFRCEAGFGRGFSHFLMKRGDLRAERCTGKQDARALKEIKPVDLDRNSGSLNSGEPGCDEFEFLLGGIAQKLQSDVPGFSGDPVPSLHVVNGGPQSRGEFGANLGTEGNSHEEPHTRRV
jgi:hypothetical protein